MQQVHTIKEAVKDPSDKTNIDLHQLNEGCSLLTQTCDTFIHTLDETMKLTNVNSSHDLETNMGIHATSPVIHPTNLAEDNEKTTNNKYIPSKR